MAQTKVFNAAGEPLLVKCTQGQKDDLEAAGVTVAEVKLAFHNGAVVSSLRFDSFGGEWLFVRLEDRANSHGEVMPVLKLTERIAFW